jgi:protein-disulfide isomerase/uncharacterized membrane protein
MKNKTNLLIYSLLVTIGLFIYLTVHHYAIQLGQSGLGLCSVSSTINCDAAATSSYSELFKIPIAVLGLCFNLVMLIIVLFKKLSWSDESEAQNGAVKILFVISSAVSVALGLISIFKIQVVCPFCLATYVFSFINTYLVWSVFSPSTFNLGSILSYKPNWTAGATIIVLSWFISGMIQDNYGLNEIKKIAPEKVALWKNATPFEFSMTTGLIQNEAAQITLIEFADFKCSHCKVASQVLHNFMQGNPKVKFIYKPFPLDGTCNPAVELKGDGTRCKMAAWALCSEKISRKGWDVHKWYFDNQDSLIQVSDMKETNTEIAKSLNLNYDEIEKCSESVVTYDEIKQFSVEAKNAKVEGTPTIFLNGKKLEYGQFPEVLRSAVNSL